jgi:anti-sigma factor RsiW
MHNIVELGLEDHLAGSVNREFDSHLAQCAQCRAEVEGMKQVSSLLGSLRADSELAPPLGFSSRLLRNIQDRQKRSIWSIFTIDPGFIRKLAVASLLGLVAFGSYLASQTDESLAPMRHTPEAVMASHDPSAAPDDPQHMNGMLMTLATYHE